MNKKYGKTLISSLVLSLGCTVFAYSASAADSEFINQISKEYASFEARHRTQYETFLKQQQGDYQTYLNQVTADFNELYRLLKSDFDAMQKKLDQDIEQLRKRYNDNSEDFKAYVRAADSGRADSAMDAYEDAINPNEAGTAMDNYEDAINPSEAGTAMDLFEDAINPSEAGSPMDQYEDAVNPSEAGSPMDEFEDESNISSANSTMDLYEDGDITKEEAQKRMKAAAEKAETALRNQFVNTSASIQKVRNETLQTIHNTRLSSVSAILEQRSRTIKELSEARAKLTGTGISFGPLTVKGWISVVINGNYQIFKQPPVTQNGSTLVPMRAIFEQLGATVQWSDKEQSVTAKKGNQVIWLKINSKTAKINGSTKTLEVAPQTINGHTMVPLRFVSESLGANVKWDSSTSIITITSQ
jgi:hypothetical protein